MTIVTRKIKETIQPIRPINSIPQFTGLFAKRITRLFVQAVVWEKDYEVIWVPNTYLKESI